MTNLGFDLRGLQDGFKAHKKRGIGVYIRSLARRMNLAPAGLELFPFYDPAYEAEEPLALGAEAYDTSWVAPLKPLMHQYVWQHFAFRPVISEARTRRDLAGFYFPSHLDAPAGMGAPYAVTAHDLIQAAMGDMYNSLKHRVHVVKQLSALKGARAVIAISHHTKADVIKYAGVDPERITVAHLGAGPEFHPGAEADLSRFNLPERFVLNVGGIDRRKNMNLLFAAFTKLLDKKPDFHLIMTGAIEEDPLFLEFSRDLEKRSLGSRVRALGYVSAMELAALYTRAEVFFYPSLYEGFGLPVLEAMACGAPVITTDRSSLPEVAGEGALTLDPGKPELFSSALIRLAESGEERAALKEKGLAQAGKFSWDKHAMAVWEALETAFGQG